MKSKKYLLLLAVLVGFGAGYYVKGSVAQYQAERTVVVEEEIKNREVPLGWHQENFKQEGISYLIPDEFKATPSLIHGPNGIPNEFFPFTTINYEIAENIEMAVDQRYGSNDAEIEITMIEENIYDVLYTYLSPYPSENDVYVSSHIYIVQKGHRFLFFPGWENMDLSDWDNLMVFLHGVRIE
ncbi:MAG: hypothetical protein HOE53_02595 [Candidatus Magasanikbacteria bacterium]|jgi:hypothetical protein|nr:hypothetical protein [Candidatus Magasanikbacteria bacterium]